MNLSLDGRGTLYEQIARAIKGSILDGQLAGNARLPSTRALAVRLGVARKSVVEAYELLATEGLVTPRVGIGTVVSVPRQSVPSDQRQPSVPPPTRYAARLRALPPITLAGHLAPMRYNLQYGAPFVNPGIYLSWTRKVSAAARRTGPGYGPSVGHPPLRAAVADYLSRRRGVLCEPEDVVIVSGTQQAISLAARVLLNEGDAVAVEDPFYEIAVHALTAHGARIMFVPVDSEGLRVCDISASASARLVLVTPSHQFPSGVVMPLARRLELLQWAASSNAWILEDDYDSEFHGGSRPVATLRSLDLTDRVIYVGSFSKSLFPALRIGYIVCPKALRSDFQRAKRLEDLGTPFLDQVALAHFIQSGLYERQLRRSVREVLRRRRALVDEVGRAMGRHVEMGPHEGGMHLVLWFPLLTSEQLDVVVARAAERGVGVQRVNHYYHVPPRAPGLLLGYASVTPGQIRSAVDILAACLRRL